MWKQEQTGKFALHFHCFSRVAHYDMNDSLRLSGKRRTIVFDWGEKMKDEVATPSCAIAFYLAPLGKAPESSKAFPGRLACLETDFFFDRISV